MSVRATSTRLSRGRSTPTSRAIAGQFSFVLGRSAHRAPPLPGRAPASFRGWPLPDGSGKGAVRLVIPSALALLVARVRADDHDATMPTDDPAFAADLLHARLDLHRGLLWRRGVPGADRSVCRL